MRKAKQTISALPAQESTKRVDWGFIIGGCLLFIVVASIGFPAWSTDSLLMKATTVAGVLIALILVYRGIELV